MTIDWTLYTGDQHPVHVATIGGHKVSIKDRTWEGGKVSLYLKADDGHAEPVQEFDTVEAAKAAAGDPDVAAIKIRIGRATIDFLDGTGAGQFADGLCGDNRGGLNDDDITLMQKIGAANRRKDGSVTVTITVDEAWGLHRYASVMVEGARDNVYPGETEALAEINSGRAVMRTLEAAGVRS